MFYSYLVRHQWERLTTLALIYTMNGIEYLVKHPDEEALVEHESLPYEVAKTLSILSNDQDCPRRVRAPYGDCPWSYHGTPFGVLRWISGSSDGAVVL